MTRTLLDRSWRLARTGSAVLALTAAALTVSGSAPGTAVSSHAATAASTQGAAPCLSRSSAERARPGSGDGVDPNDVTLAQVQQAEAGLAARTRRRGLVAGRASLPPTTIDVYVHVIERTSGSGGVSRSRIKKQIAVLNKAYAGTTSSASTATPFSFKLKHVDKTKKTSWYHWAVPTDTSDGDDVAPKTKLHRGGSEDLNLYLADLSDDLLGYSSFPFSLPTQPALDGVVVLNASLPGGKADGYNKGDTATHEVGHWLGLYHTFQDGCTSPGDEVDDTPYQADGRAKFYCDDSDTCTSAGRDPVHNFMSYGNDKCLDRFSAGQVARMVNVWQTFRVPAPAG